MSVRAVITDGFGAFGTVPDVIRMGYSPAPASAFVEVGGGGSLDWLGVQAPKKKKRRPPTFSEFEDEKALALAMALPEKAIPLSEVTEDTVLDDDDLIIKALTIKLLH